jgi:lipopolysaccharide transport system ATP-binding protein
MSEAIIQVENLGKKYRIQHNAERQRYVALRDVIAQKFAAPFKILRGVGRSKIADSSSAPTSISHLPSPAALPSSRSSSEDFWALRDVSFDVKQGEVVGIIGRNGAGKSTLLKILSRITEPTEGRIRIQGRVASLLEVGTGFHPELTGRENIFLNGAILGMHRAEIKRKFDEIVAFAEVEKFLDTPVKRYSSGMYVRLAFAVAAHLEPEILIVDEVLAVGDADFQKKCLGKMSEVARGGRTVLFVSHNMDAILRLCGSVMVVNAGRVVGQGDPQKLVTEYLHGHHGLSSTRRWANPNLRPGYDIVRLEEVYTHDEVGRSASTFDIRQHIGITMVYEVLRGDTPLIDDFNVFNEQGLFLFVAHNVQSAFYNGSRNPGRYRSTAWIPGNLLAEGLFAVSAAMVSQAPFRIHFHEEQAVSFHVTDPMAGDSARGIHVGPFPGAIRPLLKWEISTLDGGSVASASAVRA